jgi:hypothetical protein
MSVVIPTCIGAQLRTCAEGIKMNVTVTVQVLYVVAGYAKTDNVTQIHLVQSSSNVQFAIDDTDAPSDGARLHKKLALLVEGLCIDKLFQQAKHRLVWSLQLAKSLHLCHDVCCWCGDVVPATGGIVAHADNNWLACCSQVEHLAVDGV